MKRIILCLGISGCLITVVNARDLGQWEAVNPRNPGMVSGPDAAGRSERVMLRRGRRLLG
jgi:hypothetical protein